MEEPRKILFGSTLAWLGVLLFRRAGVTTFGLLPVREVQMVLLSQLTPMPGFTTTYDEHTVTGFLDGFKERDIPLGVFHFDCFWMKSYQWCDFEFGKEIFSDARGYL